MRIFLTIISVIISIEFYLGKQAEKFNNFAVFFCNNYAFVRLDRLIYKL